jgi:hypothetical protein
MCETEANKRRPSSRPGSRDPGQGRVTSSKPKPVQATCSIGWPFGDASRGQACLDQVLVDKLGEVGAERRKGLRLKRTGEVPVTMDRTKVARATHPMIELEIQTGQAGRRTGPDMRLTPSAERPIGSTSGLPTANRDGEIDKSVHP